MWPILYFSASRLMASRRTWQAFLSSSAAAAALGARMLYLLNRVRSTVHLYVIKKGSGSWSLVRNTTVGLQSPHGIHYFIHLSSFTNLGALTSSKEDPLRLSGTLKLEAQPLLHVEEIHHRPYQNLRYTSTVYF